MNDLVNDESNGSSTEQSKREAILASGSNQCFVCGPANPIGLGVQFRMGTHYVFSFLKRLNIFPKMSGLTPWLLIIVYCWINVSVLFATQ